MPIRNFRKGDEVTCAEICRLAIEEEKSVSRQQMDWLIEHENEEKFLDRLKYCDALLVYEEKEKVVGVAGLAHGELKGLYVHPKNQRKGIGSILLKEIESRARKHGWVSLRFDANPRSVPFYEKHGYHSIKEDLIKDTDIKIVWMEKRL